MTYAGSVTVKKTHLLNMIENQKHIFRSDVDDDCKWHAWGRQISYEVMLDGDYTPYSWDNFMKMAFDMKPDNMAKGLEIVFNSELS